LNFPFQLSNDDNAFSVPNPQFFKYYPTINHFWSDPGLLFTQSTTSNIRRFTGNELFKLIPDSVGTPEICTVTLTNSPNTAGYYNLSFRGDITPGLAYNATAAT
jgi:hypothetical protein